MPNPFVHVELNTADVGKAKAFYGKLFDWKLENVQMGGATYTAISPGDGTGGGIQKQQGTHASSSAWLAYVAVEDIKASTD
jgi:uncharacterized protein